MRFKGWALCALVFMLSMVVLGAAGASAQTGEQGSGGPTGSLSTWPVARSAGLDRLDSRLADVAAAAPGDGTSRARRLGLDSVGSEVRVVLEATDVAAAKSAVVKAGGRVEGTYANLVQAVVEPTELRAVAHAEGVRFVRPPFRPHPESVTSQGVAASNANTC